MQTMRTKGFSHGHVPVTALEMRGKGKRSYAFLEDFEDKSVLEDIDLIVRRHSLIYRELVPDLYESTNKYK